MPLAQCPGAVPGGDGQCPGAVPGGDGGYLGGYRLEAGILA